MAGLPATDIASAIMPKKLFSTC